MDCYVEIVKFPAGGKPAEVIKRMGPMGMREAEKVDRGANINLNHESYFTRIDTGTEPTSEAAA